MWVMGEHHLDKPYEALCREAAGGAPPRAAREAEAHRYAVRRPATATQTCLLLTLPGASGVAFQGHESNLVSLESLFRPLGLLSFPQCYQMGCVIFPPSLPFLCVDGFPSDRGFPRIMLGQRRQIQLS